MDNLLASMKNIFKSSSSNNQNLKPDFYLESIIQNGCLPFSTASVEVLAFSDEEKSQRIGNVSYKWFRNIEGIYTFFVCLI